METSISRMFKGPCFGCTADHLHPHRWRRRESWLPWLSPCPFQIPCIWKNPWKTVAELDDSQFWSILSSGNTQLLHWIVVITGYDTCKFDFYGLGLGAHHDLRSKPCRVPRKDPVPRHLFPAPMTAREFRWAMKLKPWKLGQRCVPGRAALVPSSTRPNDSGSGTSGYEDDADAPYCMSPIQLWLHFKVDLWPYDNDI